MSLAYRDFTFTDARLIGHEVLSFSHDGKDVYVKVKFTIAFDGVQKKRRRWLATIIEWFTTVVTWRK